MNNSEPIIGWLLRSPLSRRVALTLVAAPCLAVVLLWPAAAHARILKRVDSRNASSGVDCPDGSLRRGRLGDIFVSPRQPSVRTTRCTWVDMDFSRMGRSEIYNVVLRFDRYRQTRRPRHAAVALLRPVGPDLQGGVCGYPGNKELIVVRVYIVTRPRPDRWKVQLRGGASPWARDQRRFVSTVDLGRAREGRRLALKFRLTFGYRHGAATIWRNGHRVYRDGDRPLGFHYNCDFRTSNRDTTPNRNARLLSSAYLRMQHGLYRNTTAAWTLTSTGFRFSCSRRTRC